MTLLSICIPCYGRVEYVRKTLKSIFIDNADVPLEKYEVIISDNDSNQAIKGKHSASCVFFSPLFLPTFVASL